MNGGYAPNYLVDVQTAVSAIGRQNSGLYLLDLSKTLLEGITFEGNYKNVSFYKAHFKDCMFGTYAKEEYTNFRNDNFAEAVFEKVDFKHSDFQEARFANAVFISTTFEDVYFKKVDLTETQFSGGTKIYGCDFTQTIWIKSSVGSELNVPKPGKGSVQSVSFMSRSEVKKTYLEKANFEGAELINTLFEQGNYQQTIFRKATLSGVTFKDIDLSTSDFCGAQIGYKSKFYMGYGQYGWRGDYQKNYSDEVSFVNTGIKEKDLKEGKAVIVKSPLIS